MEPTPIEATVADDGVDPAPGQHTPISGAPSVNLPMPPTPTSSNSATFRHMSEFQTHHRPLPPAAPFESASSYDEVKPEQHTPSPVRVPADVVGSCYNISDSEDMDDDENNASIEISPKATYIPMPDSNTVLEHCSTSLITYSLVINTTLRIIVCLSDTCKKALDPHQALTHARSHNRHLPPLPDDFMTTLQATYQLRSRQDFEAPTSPIPPVFGLEISLHPQYFCKSCHHGYSDIRSFNSHKSNTQSACYEPPNSRIYYKSHSQRVFKQYIPVDRTKLALRRPGHSYSALLSHRPHYQFKEADNRVCQPEDQQNVEAFFNKSGWINVLSGHDYKAVAEACRAPCEEEPWGLALQSACQRYFERASSSISREHDYGFLKKIATIHANKCALLHPACGCYVNLTHLTARKPIRTPLAPWNVHPKRSTLALFANCSSMLFDPLSRGLNRSRSIPPSTTPRKHRSCRYAKV